MLLVDTNILLYAVNTNAPQHTAARQALEQLCQGRDPWCLTWGIVYEFLRVATHPRVFPCPLSLIQAYTVVQEVSRSPACMVLAETSEHQVQLEQALRLLPRLSGNQVHDLHHAILMREHGIREILTCDLDFRLFPWVTIRTLENT